jgi:hypothetical protein
LDSQAPVFFNLIKNNMIQKISVTLANGDVIEHVTRYADIGSATLYKTFPMLCRSAHTIVDLQAQYNSVCQDIENLAKYMAANGYTGEVAETLYNTQYDTYMERVQLSESLYYQLLQERLSYNTLWVRYHKELEKVF